LPRASRQRQRWDCPHLSYYFPRMDEARPGRSCRRDTRRCPRPCGSRMSLLPVVVESSENRRRVATRDVTNHQSPIDPANEARSCTVASMALASYFWFLTGPRSWNKLFLETSPKSAGNCPGVKSQANTVKGSLDTRSVRASAIARHPLGSTQWTQPA